MTNYFELYGLEESFIVDEALVKKKFYELSRQYHPDRFTLEDDDKKAEALKMSATNNNAYQTLTNQDKLVAYVLKCNNLLEEEEKYSLPPDFLMDMMELNEKVSDWEMEPDNANLAAQTKDAFKIEVTEVDEALLPFFDQYQYQKGDITLLSQIKDLYFRKKYLLRIQERMNTFASH